MSPLVSDTTSLIIVLTGAFAAGFVTGFAGFGTALVSSGFWFHALAAPLVPPLMVLSSVVAQLVSLLSVRPEFNWKRVLPFLVCGLIGLPFGILALVYASPDALRMTIGAFLVLYSVSQLLGLSDLRIEPREDFKQDGLVGLFGGFLGGFAGLSGLLPMIWLRLQGGKSESQWAIFQPYNLVILSMASIGMMIGGQVTMEVLKIAVLCMPLTFAGSFIGARIYKGVSEKLFSRVVLLLLLGSGTVLVGQIVFEKF